MEYQNCRGVRIAVPQSYGDALRLIASDFFRVTGRMERNPFRLWLRHFRSSAMGFLFYYRLSSYRRGPAYPYFRLRMEKYVRKYALQIPLSARVGEGLYLGHGVSVIVNGSAVIGNNVNLSHFVTIGSLKGSAAVIEDGAYIGPSTSLVEDVRIGSNAMVGAGAVVVRDVPAGAVAAGVPARIIKENGGYKPVNPVPLCGCNKQVVHEQ